MGIAVGVSELKVDLAMSKNMLLNLLSNALEYSPDEFIIKLISQKEGGKIILKVSETGMGIPKEHQAKMLKRFYRVSKATEINCSCTGLTLLRRYLDFMGGDIDFTMKLGKDTTFLVNIPLICNTQEPK